MKNIFTKIVIACDFIDRAIIRCALEKAFFCGFALSALLIRMIENKILETLTAFKKQAK